jgi:hypothetical protein
MWTTSSPWGTASHACEKRRQRLMPLGLRTHEINNGVTDVDYVVSHFDGDTCEVRISWSRLRRLSHAI